MEDRRPVLVDIERSKFERQCSNGKENKNRGSRKVVGKRDTEVGGMKTGCHPEVTHVTH
jgi:hypothetical protein